MKWNELKNKGWNIKHFKSISEFLKATDKPLRSDFGNRESSKTGSKSFTGTSNYNEAMELFKYGWSDKAVDLKKNLGKIKDVQEKFKYVSEYAIAGHSPSIPRYTN